MLVCLGFGIDTFHGVCHAHVLEAVAELSRAGGYLGAFSLSADMPEVKQFIEATEYVLAETAERPSIVLTSILSALECQFGNHHRTRRTTGSELFINPLMSVYWCFRLSGPPNPVSRGHAGSAELRSGEQRDRNASLRPDDTMAKVAGVADVRGGWVKPKSCREASSLFSRRACTARWSARKRWVSSQLRSNSRPLEFSCI
jgi:hypothetical protein